MNKHSSKSRGAVLIEFAIVAPLFLLLLFAMIEFGWIIQSRQAIAHASREGARYLALKGSSINQAETLAMNNLENAGLKIEHITFSGYDSDPACKKNTSEVSMEIQAPIDKLSLTGDPFNMFTKNKFITIKVVMRKECIA